MVAHPELFETQDGDVRGLGLLDLDPLQAPGGRLAGFGRTIDLF